MLMVVLLSQCEKDSSPYLKIPDDKFLARLIELGVDTDRDGKISKDEAEAITCLDLSEDSISDITGIEKFIHLEILICSDNQLLRVNLSNNTALHDLVSSSNQLIRLDVSMNSELEVLWIEDMPTLFEVCVCILPFPPPGFQLKVNGSPNVYFTTECSK